MAESKLLIVAKREFTERVRSRWFLVMTFIVPVLLAGAMLFPAWLASRSKPTAEVRNIVIIDATGAELGARVAANLAADSTLGPATSGSIGPTVRLVTPAQLPAAENNATHEVMLGKSIEGYLVLNDSALSGAAARYAGRNASSFSTMGRIESAVRQSVMMVRLEKQGVTPGTIDSLSHLSVHLSTERISERGKGVAGTTGLFAGIGVGVMLFFSILFHGQNVMRGVLEEKTTRVAEVVVSSVKPETLLGGKVLGVGAVGLVQQIAWMGITFWLVASFAPVIMKNVGAGAAGAAPTPAIGSMLGGFTLGMLAATLAYFLLGFVFYATLYAAAGAMVNSEQEAQQAAMPVMFLLMATWLMVQGVIGNPNSGLAVTLSWLPFSSPIIMPIRMGLTSVSGVTVAGSMLVAAVGCVGAIWLSARIYRMGMLMYGKKPNFRELARWIRYA
jgi:ABC-2 type transport system permease protein